VIVISPGNGKKNSSSYLEKVSVKENKTKKEGASADAVYMKSL
jgi:hypothetical protein